jgi:hypothetical protein
VRGREEGKMDGVGKVGMGRRKVKMGEEKMKGKITREPS